MLTKKIENIQFVIFDVETTGLSFNCGDRVVEIAALKLKNGRITDKFNSLINPGRQVSFEAFEVNKISNEMLKDAPKPENIFPKFLKFIQDSCLCAYNANFDTGFLFNELKLLDIENIVDNPILDILIMAKKLMPHLQRYPLWNVAQSLKISQAQLHRAMKDVEMTRQIFNKFIQMLYLKNIHNFIEMQSLFGINTKLATSLESQKLAMIQRAMDLGLKLKIKYYSKMSQAVTERQVQPKEIKQERKNKYLIGFCHLRNADRTFNLNEILEINIV